MIDPSWIAALGVILFGIGLLGTFYHKNAIVVLMCIELMLNAANLSLISFSRMWGNLDGHIFVFIVIAVAAVEVAVGRAIVISLIRNRDTVNVEDASLLKW